MTLSRLSLALWGGAWATFLLANTSRSAADADAACQRKNDSDSLEILCDAYAAAATFYILGFVCAVAAAVATFVEQFLGQKGPLCLALSLALYAIALTAEFGGQSHAVCDADPDDDSVSTFCGGFGATATFYCFAAVVALVLAYFVRDGVTKESMYSSSITFYLFLSLHALAWMTELATRAHSGCERMEDDKPVSISAAKSSVVQCNGFGFGTFTAVVTLLCALGAIGMTVKNKMNEEDDQYNRQYMSWFAIFVPYLFGALVSFGANAQIQCQIYNDDDDNECSGNVSASVFTTLAVLIACLGLVGTHYQKFQMRNTSWLMAWGLFFLAYTCYLGGHSAASCQDLDDTDDKKQEDVYSAICNGYGAATFFMFSGFLLVVVAVFFEFRAHPGNDFFEIHFHSPQDGSGPAFTPIDDEDPAVPSATAEPFYDPHEQLGGQKSPNSFDTADL